MPNFSYSFNGAIDDVLAQLWSLLEAKSKFTSAVTAMNRRKLTEDTAYDEADRGVETTPRLTITPGAFNRISGSDTELKYGQEFDFDLVGEQPDVKMIDRLRLTLVGVFEGAGQNLGLNTVSSWTIPQLPGCCKCPPKPKAPRTSRRQAHHTHLLRLTVEINLQPDDLATWLG